MTERRGHKSRTAPLGPEALRMLVFEFSGHLLPDLKDHLAPSCTPTPERGTF